jgi:hypothetical protein
MRAESGLVGAGKDREAKGDRMLWDDTTLSRHFEIERNCEIRPATAFGGEVCGPVEVECWRIWAVGGNPPTKRLQPTYRSVASPLPSATTQVISENFCVEPER